MSNYINTSRALHFHRPIFPWDSTNSGEKHRNIKKTTNYQRSWDRASLWKQDLPWEDTAPFGKLLFLFLTLASSCTQGPDLTDTKVCLTYYKRKPFLFAKWKQTLAKVKKKNNCLFFVVGVFSSFHWRSTTPIKCKLWSTSLWSVTSWGWDKTWCSWGQGGLMFPAPRIGINRPQIQSEQSNSWMTYRLPCQSDHNHNQWVVSCGFVGSDGQ